MKLLLLLFYFYRSVRLRLTLRSVFETLTWEMKRQQCVRWDSGFNVQDGMREKKQLWRVIINMEVIDVIWSSGVFAEKTAAVLSIILLFFPKWSWRNPRRFLINTLLIRKIDANLWSRWQMKAVCRSPRWQIIDVTQTVRGRWGGGASFKAGGLTEENPLSSRIPGSEGSVLCRLWLLTSSAAASRIIKQEIWSCGVLRIIIKFIRSHIKP